LASIWIRIGIQNKALPEGRPVGAVNDRVGESSVPRGIAMLDPAKREAKETGGKPRYALTSARSARSGLSAMCQHHGMALRSPVLVLFVMTAVAQASPVDDLASPSQATRDAAAARLRATYRPLPGEVWIRKFGAIRPGAPRKSVVDQLQGLQAVPTGVTVGADAKVENYRLDDGWILLCKYRSPADTVIKCELRNDPRQVSVNPPRGYTGSWTDYFVSGQPASVASFKSGVPVGTTTVFHDNGTKALVRTYGPNGHATSTVWYNPAGVVVHRVGGE
jgi:hypothetical protein